MRVLERQFGQQVSLTFSLAHHILHVPYKWCPQLEAVQFCGGIRTKILFALNMLAYVVYQFYCVWRFLSLIHKSDTSASGLANLAYRICGNMIPMIALNHVRTSWGSLGVLLNAALNYYRGVSGKGYFSDHAGYTRNSI